MKIVNQVQAYPQATLVYSPPGVGKTEFAAYFPKPIFLMIDLEIGLKTLIKEGRVPANTAHKEEAVTSFDELMDDLDWLASADHNYESLVIDTLNSAQFLLKRKITQQHFYNREDKFEAFAKGWERCEVPWNAMLHRLNQVRARGMRVIGLAHSEVSMMRNPDGEDYQAHTPKINSKVLWVPTNAFFDNVLFMNLEVCAVTDKAQQSVKEKSHRLLYVQADAGHFAKNRFGLDHPISCGKSGKDTYQNFFNAIVAKKPKKTVKPDAVPPETKTPPAETTLPATETITAPTETPPAPAGKEWVQTWLNRIAASDKIGPAISQFNDILSDYSSAVEPDQVQDFPAIFQAWLDNCLKIGGTKGKEQAAKKLQGNHGLSGKIVTQLLESMNRSQAA